MIEIRNLWFRYPNGTLALKNLSVVINKGITAVLGPNGSGKTTLLKILGLLYKPTKGIVKIDNINYWSLKNNRIIFRRKVVYVHEKPILIRGTVLDNLMYGLLIRGYSKEEAINRSLKILEELNIKHLATKKSKDLSAGEAQIVSIARALVLKPKYLLLDEPTANLDLSKKRNLIRFLNSLSQNNTYIILATHDHFTALKLANYALLLEEGKLIKYGHIDEVLKEL